MKTINNKDFVESLTKVLLNSVIIKAETIRKDFVTKSLLNLIRDLDLNKNLRWITYEEFKGSLKKNII